MRDAISENQKLIKTRAIEPRFGGFKDENTFS
jgi:hypothetical protein